MSYKHYLPHGIMACLVCLLLLTPVIITAQEEPAETPTETPLPTDIPTEIPTETPLPTDIPTEIPTETPLPTETSTETPTETPLPTDIPTEIPTETPLPTETPTEILNETLTPEPSPTWTPTVVPGAPPQVIGANIVGLPTNTDIMQLQIDFSEAMQIDVTNPANYSLFTVGADGLFETSACGTAQGDDGLVSIQSVSYDEGMFIATLNTLSALPMGQYRLLACAALLAADDNAPLDGNGDDAGGDDFSFDFVVEPPPPLIVHDLNLYAVPETPLDINLDVSGGRPPYNFIVNAASNGVISGSAPALVYTSNPGYIGLDTFIVSVLDANLVMTSITVRVSTSAPLVANDDYLFTAYHTAIPFQLWTTDGTAPVTFTVIAPPVNGTLSGTAPALVYTPNAGFSGDDSLTFKAVDALGFEDTGVVNITVGQPLVAGGENIETRYETPVSISLGASGGTWPYSYSVSTPAHGTLVGDAPDLIYTPNAGFTGTDSFDFTVTDSIGNIDTATVTITMRIPLVTTSQYVSTSEETALPILLNASGGLPPYQFVTTIPADGVLIGTNGSLTYIAQHGFVGTDSFDFVVTDAMGDSVSGSITVAISSANTAVNNVDGLVAAVNSVNDVPVTISLAPGMYTLTGNLVISGEVTIRGGGAIIEGGALVIASGAHVTLDALTVSHSGTILNNGVLLVNNSTLWGNAGSAIDNQGGSVIVVNSTITQASGAGINNQGGSVSVTNSTITYNAIGAGNNSGYFGVSNTLLADNGTNCTGAITSNGYNLDSGSTCGLSASGDLSNINPNLGGLQGNGGPTMTQALLTGSPALDAGDNAACYWADQRGAQRPVDNNEDGIAVCDIGAYEAPSVNPPQPPSGAPVLTFPTSALVTNANPLTLSWNAVNGLGGPFNYQIQIDNNSDYSSPEVDISRNALSYTATTLADGLYYWHVRAINGVNVAAAWSSSWNFTLDTTAPLAPALSAPANAAPLNDTTPVFTWAASTSATSYHLQVSPYANFYTTPINLETTARTYTVPAAIQLTLGRYYWRVQARDAAGNWSVWSLLRTVDITPLRTPLDATSTTDTTPAFLWYAVTGATRYQLQVSTTSWFSNPTSYTIAIPTVTYTPPAMAYGIYYWRVNVDKGLGFESSPVVWRLTVTPAAPVAPTLSSPATGFLTNADTVGLAWNVVTSAGSPFMYQIQVDDNTNFSSPVQDVITWDLIYPVNGLADGAYSWRVRAINFVEVPGAWSLVRTVTVDTTPPPAPVLSAPANLTSVTSGRPTLTWTAATGANRYRIDLADNPSFTNPRLSNYEVTTASLALTAAVMPSPLVEGNYYWRVQARDAAGNWGSQSQTRSFGVFVGSAPANGLFSTDTTPTFTWVAVTGVTGYQLQLATDTSFSNLVSGFPITLGPVVTYIPLTPLAPGTYYWRILVGGEIPSDIVYRTLFIGAAPAATTLVSPANTAVLNSARPMLTWNAVTPPTGVSVVGYEVQFATNTAFTTGVESMTTSSTYLIPSALPNGLRYWRVRALFAAGSPGVWSAYRYFTIDTIAPPVPATTAPAPGAVTADTTPAFTWKASSGANLYQIQIDDDPLFGSPIGTQTASVTFTVPAASVLPSGQYYYWRVRARDAAGNWSPYTVTYSFRVS